MEYSKGLGGEEWKEKAGGWTNNKYEQLQALNGKLGKVTIELHERLHNSPTYSIFVTPQR